MNLSKGEIASSPFAVYIQSLLNIFHWSMTRNKLSQGYCLNCHVLFWDYLEYLTLKRHTLLRFRILPIFHLERLHRNKASKPWRVPTYSRMVYSYSGLCISYSNKEASRAPVSCLGSRARNMSPIVKPNKTFESSCFESSRWVGWKIK